MGWALDVPGSFTEQRTPEEWTGGEAHRTVTLAATRGNQIRAADLLGVNRNTLRKKIRDLEIQVFRSGG